MVSVVMNVLDGVIAVVLGSVMLVAGLGKLLRRPDAFVYTLTQFATKLGFPPSARVFRLMALSLPWCQILVGSFLLKGVLVREVTLIAVVMFVVFASMQAVLLLKGERPSCGCFGLLMQERVGPCTVMRDAILATLGVLLAIM